MIVRQHLCLTVQEIFSLQVILAQSLLIQIRILTNQAQICLLVLSPLMAISPGYVRLDQRKTTPLHLLPWLIMAIFTLPQPLKVNSVVNQTMVIRISPSIPSPAMAQVYGIFRQDPLKQILLQISWQHRMDV